MQITIFLIWLIVIHVLILFFKTIRLSIFLISKVHVVKGVFTVCGQCVFRIQSFVLSLFSLCCVDRRKVAPLDPIGGFQMSSFRTRKVSVKRGKK